MRPPSTRHSARSAPALLALVASAFAFTGCATTSLTDLWRDPGYSGPPARNLLVISMARATVRRRLWEDAFVGELRKKGASATASYTLFPDALPDTESVKQKVRENGYDAVIVTHRLGTEQVERFVPPTVTTVPVTRVNPWGYYRTFYEHVQQPGYVETDRVVQFQTDFWVADGQGGRLVWIGRSETVNPTSPSDLGREMGGRIIPELVKIGRL